MPRLLEITPFLWFDGNAEEAIAHCTSILPNSRTTAVTRNGPAGPGKPGSVLVASFELDGQTFTALDGGPGLPFTQAISFVVHCDTQEEVDHDWDLLLAGGSPNACGWLRDRFGLSWQITLDVVPRLLGDPDVAKAGRIMQAMMQMVKIDIAALRKAAAG